MSSGFHLLLLYIAFRFIHFVHTNTFNVFYNIKMQMHSKWYRKTLENWKCTYSGNTTIISTKNCYKNQKQNIENRERASEERPAHWKCVINFMFFVKLTFEICIAPLFRFSSFTILFYCSTLNVVFEFDIWSTI